MKNRLSLAIILLAFLSFSCSKKTETVESKALEEAKAKYSLGDIFKQEAERSNDIIVLLSIKYELPSDLTQKIINEFSEENAINKYMSILNAKTVEEVEQLASKFKKPPIKDRIIKFSMENNVSQSKIASLLIDYKIWYESQSHD